MDILTIVCAVVESGGKTQPAPLPQTEGHRRLRRVGSGVGLDVGLHEEERAGHAAATSVEEGTYLKFAMDGQCGNRDVKSKGGTICPANQIRGSMT